ncbi:U32 family peptidase [Patescibacteria group bacterium]|nr:U32 family peptidase [Patescibacteria group bacterium]
MKLTVPTNWQNDLIKKINKPNIDTVYGKLDRDFFGGGRPSCISLKVTKKQIKKHICEIHNNSLKFYYILNSTCIGGRELTGSGQKRIHELLTWLSEIKADGVVVAIPYLTQLIRKHYPHFEISVSCFAHVNSVIKAKFWEDLGASIITLPQTEMTRRFKLMKKIKESVRCELQLIVNDNCIQDCPLFLYHHNLSSHGSQTSSKLGIFMFDYCRFMCRSKMIADPVNFIRSAWIRPEDIAVYEDMGIEKFKVVDRNMTTEAIAFIVDTYLNRKHDGNLYDLFMNPSKSLWLKRPNFLHKIKYFFHPFAVNIFKLVRKKGLLKDLDVYIDNRKLDGFIDHFLKEDCYLNSCEDCRYCIKIAEQTVRINPEYKQNDANNYSRFLKEIISGEIFKYWG